MHTSVYFIPDFSRALAQVIAMPMHHRKRKYVRAELDTPVLSVAPCRDGSYKAGKELVVRLCARRKLEQWQTNICVGLYARAVSAGRTKGNALQIARKEADRFARPARDLDGGTAA